jgi:hypothetical protein
MGLCTFFLIFAPAAALLYVPLTMRMHELQPAHAGVSQTPAAPAHVRNENLRAFPRDTFAAKHRWNSAA